MAEDATVVNSLTPDERDELERLRVRVAELERERFEHAERANAAIAAAQERAYWLDRWHLDLNALMRRPGAAQARGAIRAVRAVVRFLLRMLRYARRG
jgi:hypothetical protein